MSPFVCISVGVKIGKGVNLSHFINAYRGEINHETTWGPFTEHDWHVERTRVKKGASTGSGATNGVIGENQVGGAGSRVSDVPARQSWQETQHAVNAPVCEKVAGAIVSLPMYPQLTAEQQVGVVNQVVRFTEVIVAKESS